ncbi:uncharacterized protein LOC116951976 isoform X1 [Petromyzon marinus]|uniref:uncharacterized protein LOC116951976 isoform X1 n=1 Tax=Petromyzon marinus TaxID=7757 RepID=UPI003F6FAD66
MLSLPPLPSLLLLLALSSPCFAAGARYADNLFYGAPSPGSLDAGHANTRQDDRHHHHQQQQQQQQTMTTAESAVPPQRGGRRARFALQDEVNLLAFGLLQLGQGVRELSERTAERLAAANGAVERAAAAAHGAERRASEAEKTARELRERLGRLEEAWVPARRREARRDESESGEGDDVGALDPPSELSERNVESTRLRLKRELKFSSEGDREDRRKRL